jgi:signal transduction histidine kinase
MNRYLATGERRVIGKGRVQLEARRKDGSLFPVELSISSAESEHGELFVSFARDISRRVAAEQELIKARDEAVAGERAKADLIAVMSHEMRTPLNGMLGTLELARRRRARSQGHRIPRHHPRVGAAASAPCRQRARNLARGGRKDRPAHDVFSLSALVRELAESQRSVAEHRGNALSHRVETLGNDYALGDPTRIRQVLLNLIGNAIKFTRNGAIALEAERLGRQRGRRVPRHRHRHRDRPEADQARVFDDFVTLDTSYSRAVGGTGLGLAIVKRLAGALGGEVGLESAPGEGSLFWVRLPLPAAEGAHAQAAPDSAGGAGRPGGCRDPAQDPDRRGQPDQQDRPARPSGTGRTRGRRGP